MIINAKSPAIRRKSNNKLKRQLQNHAFVHLGWTIAALIFLLVAVLSVKLGPNDNVKDILNFAVSLSSLMLAGFAIVQALISGSALPDAVAQVRSAVNDVRGPVNILADAAQVIDAHSQNLNESATQINSFTAEFQKSRQIRTPENDVVQDAGIDVSERFLDRCPPVVTVALYAVLCSYDTSKSYYEAYKSIGNISGFSMSGTINTLAIMGVIKISNDFK